MTENDHVFEESSELPSIHFQKLILHCMKQQYEITSILLPVGFCRNSYRKWLFKDLYAAPVFRFRKTLNKDMIRLPKVTETGMTFGRLDRTCLSQALN